MPYLGKMYGLSKVCFDYRASLERFSMMNPNIKIIFYSSVLFSHLFSHIFIFIILKISFLPSIKGNLRNLKPRSQFTDGRWY